MSEQRSDELHPVFLEPRDDYWTIHAPEHVSTDDQRAYRLVPRGTAERLKNAVYCEDCFPHADPHDRG